MYKKIITSDLLGSVSSVPNEISPLKEVLLHRPGRELLNLVPEYLPEMLFDDIPWLEKAQEEHDYFSQELTKNGTKVTYLEDLVEQSIVSEQVKEQFVMQYIAESSVYTDGARKSVKDFLYSVSNKQMIEYMFGGIRKSEITNQKQHLADYLSNDYPFVCAPMPNLYFSRDPFSFVGNGVIISKMYTNQRQRETLFAEYIFNYHKEFSKVPQYYSRDAMFSIEGGDILMLNSSTLAVGISQRTHPSAVEKLAKNLLFGNSGITTVLAIDIPKNRSFMHLDTVFTMLDKDKFTIHPNTMGQFNAFILTAKDGELLINQKLDKIENILKEVLGLNNITLIKCGGNNSIDSAREQWSDGANTLAIAPGEVIVYARNNVTNKLLEQNGVIIHQIPCSELSRGRGGPRCMSMPIKRN
ncbi:MAG: arginine deiminase [Clostridia bacterium]